MMSFVLAVTPGQQLGIVERLSQSFLLVDMYAGLEGPCDFDASCEAAKAATWTWKHGDEKTRSRKLTTMRPEAVS
jgi:hypothetical protein